MQAYKTLVASDEAITKELKSLENRGKTWQKDVQTVLMSIMVRWQSEKGDVRKVVEHANAMSNWDIQGVRLNSLRQWWCDRGLIYDEETKVFSYAQTKSKEDIKSIEEWWKATKEADFKPFDAYAEVEKLLRRIENRQSKRKEGDNIPAEVVSALRQIKNPDATA